MFAVFTTIVGALVLLVLDKDRRGLIAAGPLRWLVTAACRGYSSHWAVALFVAGKLTAFTGFVLAASTLLFLATAYFIVPKDKEDQK